MSHYQQASVIKLLHIFDRILLTYIAYRSSSFYKVVQGSDFQKSYKLLCPGYLCKSKAQKKVLDALLIKYKFYFH